MIVDSRDRFTQKVIEVLREPDLYPDEFRAFVPKLLENNVLLKIASYQLPDLDPRHDVGASGSPSFSGTWVNYGGANEVAGFYKDISGRAFLYGLVKSGTSGSTIFTLPSSYKPRARESFAVITNVSAGQVDVDGSGNVIHVAGGTGFVSLSGISFRTF